MSSGCGLASSLLERVSQAGWRVGAHIEKGIFYGPPTINRSDIWAQEAMPGTMASSRSKCTPVGDPIQSVAVFESNPTLYYYGLNYMTPEVFPTVILHDVLGAFRTDQITEKYHDTTMQVFVCALNLYMVSQNCNVSHAKKPLVKPPNASSMAAAAGGKKPSSERFNGLLFVNGTVLDAVPPGFCFSEAGCSGL
ncbi:hypothetical protein LEL_09324 [Akanthomyces lecanii RCEF 1005]|uniref:Uncharacterized protein n=1 Tax=Akanthomyces lecanii RCEF 1005 TaxID=1081108 RepID=A0A168BZ55_CORDF|nr:hypothetical protein LEL_09324 [Akanthomyces lecanii RCEF 1005]